MPSARRPADADATTTELQHNHGNHTRVTPHQHHTPTSLPRCGPRRTHIVPTCATRCYHSIRTCVHCGAHVRTTCVLPTSYVHRTCVTPCPYVRRTKAPCAYPVGRTWWTRAAHVVHGVRAHGSHHAALWCPRGPHVVPTWARCVTAGTAGTPSRVEAVRGSGGRGAGVAQPGAGPHGGGGQRQGRGAQDLGGGQRRGSAGRGRDEGPGGRPGRLGQPQARLRPDRRHR